MPPLFIIIRKRPIKWFIMRIFLPILINLSQIFIDLSQKPRVWESETASLEGNSSKKTASLEPRVCEGLVYVHKSRIYLYYEITLSLPF